jgi:uncharacterized SAM-binding protein YcdF (DUF218 family)
VVKAVRKILKWVLRLTLVFSSVIVLYLVVTFGQVWWASTRDGAHEADAIVVLGAAQYDGRPSEALAARLDHAYTLWDDELAEVIVVTGGGQEGDRFTEAFASFEYLRDKGVPQEDLRLEVDGTNTWEQLAASARFLRREERERVLLVSSPYHAFRIVATAEELGLDATASPADGSASFGDLARETAAVAIGRIIGYRRLAGLT